MSILLSLDAHVATLTLNRPDRLNAFDLPTIGQLHALLSQLAADPQIRAVILTGAGRAFCAGGDMAVIHEARPDVDVPDIRRLFEVVELLHEMPKVTIAAINGACAGAGLALATACDLRYAATSAVFTTAFLKVGQSGDYGITWFLPRIVGTAKARELLLLAERFGAEAALGMGLVSAVLASDLLLNHVRDVAGRIAATAPLSTAAMKANLHDALGLPLSDLLDLEATRLLATAATGDAREAVAAYLEKRAPRFTGE